MKTLKLVKPDNGINIKVKFIPMGNKIKYTVTGKVYCTRMKNEISNSRTLGINDLVWYGIFSKIELKKFLKKNRGIYKVIPMTRLYDTCEIIKN